jgi:uncharacterized protein Yka (UPF0111/DUF47 family)
MNMIFEDRERDWKESLSPETQQLLASMFDSAKRHKGAYLQADDVKVAQIWCALVELKKEIKNLEEQIDRVSAPFHAIATVGESEKRRAIQKLIGEIVRPTEEGTSEATKRLVESLMKF